MANQIETGNAKNVANFEQMIIICTGYGADYNPSQDPLRIATLTGQYNAAFNQLDVVKAAERAFETAVNSRRSIFKPSKPLLTRVVNALQASNVTAETMDDAKGINRKVRGIRAVPKQKKLDTEKGLTEADDTYISVSQQSYDLQADHWGKMIQLLASQANYKPNEADLTVVALRTLRTSMKAANTNVGTAYNAFKNALIERDRLVYAERTGLVDTAKAVKNYVKSIFGASHEKFRQADSLHFKARPKV